MKRLIVLNALLLATIASLVSGRLAYADPSIAVNPGAAGFNNVFQVSAFDYEPNTQLTISVSTGATPLWTIIDVNATTDGQGSALFNVRPSSFPNINPVVQAEGSGAFVVWGTGPQQSVSKIPGDPNFGFRVPDLVSNLRVDQSWSFAVCDTTKCAGMQVNVGHPADRFGFGWLGGGNPANQIPVVRFAF